jgi:hypothetical protein
MGRPSPSRRVPHPGDKALPVIVPRAWNPPAFPKFTQTDLAWPMSKQPSVAIVAAHIDNARATVTVAAMTGLPARDRS